MKKGLRKLTLSKETLRRIDSSNLMEVHGASDMVTRCEVSRCVLCFEEFTEGCAPTDPSCYC
jgi:hypothetical protein